MKTPQLSHGVIYNGEEITTPLGLPRGPQDTLKVGEKIEITNPDLLLDPRKQGFIQRVL